MDFQKHGDDYGKLLSVIPWIRHIFPEWSSYRGLRDGNMKVYNFMKLLVDKHIQSFNEDHERNFIDMYIREMKESQKLDIKNSSFHCG